MVLRMRAQPFAALTILLGLAACGSDSKPESVDNTCDPIVPEFCAFPFPNDFFTREDATSPTGLRLDLKSGFFMQTDPTVFNVADGWSTGQTILFQLPNGTDRGFPTPTDEGIASSITTSSKTVILDTETGELVPHFAEEDKNSLHIGTRALTIRPVVPLEHARRYIVAVRGVVDEGDALVPASEAFVALRDGVDSTDPAVRSRRKKFNGIFAALEQAGIPREDLQLAWDFTTGSVENVTGWLLHMRDEGLRLVREAGHPYTITEVRTANCAPFEGRDFSCIENDDANVRFYIVGTFRAPNYMSEQKPGGRLLFDEAGLPQVNAENPWHDQVFHMIIPASATPEEPKPLLQYGHGLFGAASQIGAGHFRAFMNEFGYVFFGTALDGMAEPDSVWAGATLAGSSNIGNLSPMFERLHQGMMQQIILMDTVIEGFSKDEDFGAYLDPSVRHYHGISQGGIMGAVYAAISPHIERAALGVMGQPYSLLLFRSVDFTPFFGFMQIRISDPRGWQMGISLAQMLWDRVEPNGYTVHLRPGQRLRPDVTVKNVLMRGALGDHQVNQLGAHIMARALGAKALDTGVRPNGIFGIETVGSTSETENFLAEYDFGNPIDPPCNLPPAYKGKGICDDPHGKLRKTRAAEMQLAHYLLTGEGQNFCPDGEEIDESGDCIFPTAGTPAPDFSANCGMTDDGMFEENDDLSLHVCGLL